MWERTYGQHPPGVLAVTDDTVLVGSARQVQALSAATGDVLWSHAIPAYPVAVTTAAGVAYVVALRDPLSDPNQSEVYAFQV